jgi:hypothetical protein
MWMAWRTKTKSMTVACDSLLEIIHVSQMLKAGGHGVGEVIEG